MGKHLRVDELRSKVRDLYQDAPALMRKMMEYRLYICPFDRLLGEIPEGASVLDVGCGAGLFLALAASNREGVRGYGFDSSKVAVEAAQAMTRRMKQAGGQVEVEYADVGAAWPSEEFDVVSLVDVLHHIPPQAQRQVFEEALRHVKPGGALLYKDMADEPWGPALMNRMHDLLLARQWIHYVPVEDTELWAKAKGFHLEKAEEMQLYWYRHELRVFRRFA